MRYFHATEYFQCFKVLSDPPKKQEYDRFGSAEDVDPFKDSHSDDPYFSSEIFRSIFSRFAGGPIQNPEFSGSGLHNQLREPNIHVKMCIIILFLF